MSSVREWWWPQVSPSPRGVTSLPGCPLPPVMSGITFLTSVRGQALCNLWDSKSSLDLSGFWHSKQWIRRPWRPYRWITFPLSLSVNWGPSFSICVLSPWLIKITILLIRAQNDVCYHVYCIDGANKCPLAIAITTVLTGAVLICWNQQVPSSLVNWWSCGRLNLFFRSSLF